MCLVGLRCFCVFLAFFERGRGLSETAFWAGGRAGAPRAVLHVCRLPGPLGAAAPTPTPPKGRALHLRALSCSSAVTLSASPPLRGIKCTSRSSKESLPVPSMSSPTRPSCSCVITSSSSDSFSRPSSKHSQAATRRQDLVSSGATSRQSPETPTSPRIPVTYIVTVAAVADLLKRVCALQPGLVEKADAQGRGGAKAQRRTRSQRNATTPDEDEGAAMQADDYIRIQGRPRVQGPRHSPRDCAHA